MFGGAAWPEMGEPCFRPCEVVLSYAITLPGSAPFPGRLTTSRRPLTGSVENRPICRFVRLDA